MKYFVGIDLGTTNSGRFKSGGTSYAPKLLKGSNFIAALKQTA